MSGEKTPKFYKSVFMVYYVYPSTKGMRQKGVKKEQTSGYDKENKSKADFKKQRKC